MLKKTRNIINYLTFMACFICFAACSSEDDGYKDFGQDVSASTNDGAYYMTFTITNENTNKLKASNLPNGGEEADGNEEAINNENKIHDINVFIYTKGSGGLDQAISASDIKSQIYLDKVGDFLLPTSASDLSITTEAIKVEGLSLNTEYNVAIIANYGSKINLNDITNTSGFTGLANTAISRAWTADATTLKKDYDNFVMSSIKASTIKVTQQNNTAFNPATTSITLRRLAARIDIVPKTSTNEAEYDVDTYTYNVGTDKVKILGISAVNKWKGDEYLFRHIAPAKLDGSIDNTSTPLCEANETKDENNISTNYVITPSTLSKTATATSINDFFTNSIVANCYDNYVPYTPSADGMPKCDADKSYILDYVMENTLDKQQQSTKYVTGICIKARYIPNTFTEGETFYTYGDQKYKSLAELNTAGLSTTSEGVKTYEDGICYYYYWIRHSNNNNTTNGIMEFGIVRNNIYRLTIESFKTIGPNNPTPDIKTEYVDISLKAIPWTILVHPTIEF